MRLSVIIPLLDEQETLRELHSRLVSTLERIAPGEFEVLFVDDGSTDGSASILEEIAKLDGRVALIQLRRTFGKAAALSAGFHEARGEVIVTLDADLQDVPEEIPRMLARLGAGADLATGRKRRRRDPWTRRIASRLFNRAVSRASGVAVRDVNSGFKVMRREVARDVPLHGELHRYLPILAHAKGYAIAEVDVEHEPRRFGRSRYGWSRYLAGLLDLGTVLMITRYDKRPLHFFGVVGLLLLAFGAVVLAYLGVGWFFGHWIGNRPLLTLGVLTALLGVQSVFFGVLAELIVLRDRERDPGYSVRRVVRGPAPDRDGRPGQGGRVRGGSGHD